MDIRKEISTFQLESNRLSAYSFLNNNDLLCFFSFCIRLIWMINYRILHVFLTLIHFTTETKENVSVKQQTNGWH